MTQNIENLTGNQQPTIELVTPQAISLLGTPCAPTILPPGPRPCAPEFTPRPTPCLPQCAPAQACGPSIFPPKPPGPPRPPGVPH